MQNDNQKAEKLTLFDEKCAESQELGCGGKALKVKVNRFNIILENSLDSLHVYSVVFPIVRGRPVKNANVKKIMMQRVLSEPAWANEASTDDIYTDCDNLLITKGSLNDISSPTPVTRDSNGMIEVRTTFHNQSSATPENVTIKVHFLHQLDMGQLRNYLKSLAPTELNFSKHTRAFNVLVKHYAAKNPTVARAGRNRFFAAPDPHAGNRFPSGLLARDGFFSSIRPAMGSLQLQLDTTTPAFYPHVTYDRIPGEALLQ